MAGVPFDLLTEADLTNLAKLASYDTLIFPSFRNVPADKLTAIQDTLTTLVKNYHVGLITAGDFMTNDETGAALPGDSYARMKSLLGVSRVDGASGVTVDVAARQHHQPRDGRLHRRRADPRLRRRPAPRTSPAPSAWARTLASQVVNGQTYNAVLATETGGRNVHFATEGMLADNNMLAHALDWTAQPASGPELSLHMSRDKAIVASRNDMDQAMETADVHPATGPGIYDKLLPILDQWKAGLQLRRLLLHRHRQRRRAGPDDRLGLFEALLRPDAGDGQRDRLALLYPSRRTPTSSPRRSSSPSSSSRARSSSSSSG